MTSDVVIPASLGQEIPADTAHAVSVSLPTWRCNVGYEEGEDWVISRMSTGYPRWATHFSENETMIIGPNLCRFFIHKTIISLAMLIVQQHASEEDGCLLLQSYDAAVRCAEFLQSCSSDRSCHVRILEFEPVEVYFTLQDERKPILFAVIHHSSLTQLAKSFWQHTGEGISSRRAEYCLMLYKEGLLVEQNQCTQTLKVSKGPKRYTKDATEELQPSSLEEHDTGSAEHVLGTTDCARFLEERFGRNLDVKLAQQAKTAIRRRIAESLIAERKLANNLQMPEASIRLQEHAGLKIDDVYLYPGGMNSIYSTYRMSMLARGTDIRKSICFGFPYIDTLKVLEKFGPGVLFYGNGDDRDLDDLEQRLTSGEKYNALFCEFPSNPLLRCPNLDRLWELSRRHDLIIVIDETVGNFLNTHILPFADVVVSSLTKVFSGDSNVMGGSAVLNPQGQYYDVLKNVWSNKFEDLLWPEDAVFLERNSRDFVQRIQRINLNAEAACETLLGHPKIKDIYYPKVNPSRPYYDARKTVKGGYGGLLSVTFHSTQDAAAFYDNLQIDKGPSLGTNFTLASPFVILAHYNELDWAESYGVDRNLVRFSIGLEDTDVLLGKLRQALDAI